MSKIARNLERNFNKLGTFNKSIFNRIYLYFVDKYILNFKNIKILDAQSFPKMRDKKAILHDHC